jgi:hypothetical protein
MHVIQILITVIAKKKNYIITGYEKRGIPKLQKKIDIKIQNRNRILCLTQSILTSKGDKMKQKVLKCWQGKKAETVKIDGRVTLSEGAEGEGMTRSVHAYGRSQCRTTHKRQDC